MKLMSKSEKGLKSLISKKAIFLLVLMLGIVIIAGCGNSTKITGNGVDSTNNGNTITVFKSQHCGCCVGYVAELERNGFNVKTVNVEDMSLIKDKFNIPQNMQSCHTAVAGDYFIEGHVPIEAVKKMLEEKPAINGIALPGMPAGSPGMPGVKNNEWTIHALKNGKISEFMRI